MKHFFFLCEERQHRFLGVFAHDGHGQRPKKSQRAPPGTVLDAKARRHEGPFKPLESLLAPWQLVFSAEVGLGPEVGRSSMI